MKRKKPEFSPGKKVRIGSDNYEIEGKDPEDASKWIVFKFVKKSCWDKKGRKFSMSLTEERIREIETEGRIQGTLSEIFEKSPSRRGDYSFGNCRVD